MTDAQLKELVLRQLGEIAPEADAAALDVDADLREELELDSMDFLNFVTRLHDGLGLEIPEADYARLATLQSAVEYLSGRLAAEGGFGAGR